MTEVPFPMAGIDPVKERVVTAMEYLRNRVKWGFGPTFVRIAVALAVAACRAGYSIYFTSLDDMVRNLKAAEAAGRLLSKLGTYLRPRVLVVDEVGHQPLERAEANLVFQVPPTATLLPVVDVRQGRP